MKTPYSARVNVTETFCLRVTVAMLYRAGLDTMDRADTVATEAREFLDSDFAMLALQVLQSREARNFDWGDVSDYLGQIQRVNKQRYGTELIPKRVVCLDE